MKYEFYGNVKTIFILCIHMRIIMHCLEFQRSECRVGRIVLCRVISDYLDDIL